MKDNEKNILRTFFGGGGDIFQLIAKRKQSIISKRIRCRQNAIIISFF